MEAFFSTVKNEVGERYESHGEAKGQLFDYIEVLYNQRRSGLEEPGRVRTQDDSSRVAKPSTGSDQAQCAVGDEANVAQMVFKLRQRGVRPVTCNMYIGAMRLAAPGRARLRAGEAAEAAGRAMGAGSA